jgi:hypothetical protein
LATTNEPGTQTEAGTLVSLLSGETGRLLESEPPPLRGPLLWEMRREVSGDASCYPNGCGERGEGAETEGRKCQEREDARKASPKDNDGRRRL